MVRPGVVRGGLVAHRDGGWSAGGGRHVGVAAVQGGLVVVVVRLGGQDRRHRRRRRRSRRGLPDVRGGGRSGRTRLPLHEEGGRLGLARSDHFVRVEALGGQLDAVLRDGVRSLAKVLGGGGGGCGLLLLLLDDPEVGQL